MKNCNKCIKKANCKELCPEALDFANQGIKWAKEINISDLNWTSPESDNYSSSADYLEFHAIDPSSSIYIHNPDEKAIHDELRGMREQLKYGNYSIKELVVLSVLLSTDIERPSLKEVAKVLEIPTNYRQVKYCLEKVAERNKKK